MATIGYCAAESEMIRSLWGKGKSAHEVAAAVNSRFGRQRTRNAVIGHVHRLGLSRRGRGAANPVKIRKPRKPMPEQSQAAGALPSAKRMKSGATTVAKKRAQVARSAARDGAPAAKSGASHTKGPKTRDPRPAAPRARFLPVAKPPLDLDVLQLTDGTCRYPVTKAVPHKFCGHPSLPGKSWCDAHHAHVYRGPELAGEA